MNLDDGTSLSLLWKGQERKAWRAFFLGLPSFHESQKIDRSSIAKGVI